MITHNQFKQLKQLQLIGASQRAIAERIGITKHAVKRWWKSTEEEFLAAEAARAPQLDQYRGFMLDHLTLCPQIRQTNLLYKLEQHFPNFKTSKHTFYRYVKKLREEHDLSQFTKRLTTARESTLPAEEAQVDFGQMKLKTMYGTTIKVYFFCMVLNYSNYRFFYFEPKPFTTETAIRAHNYAFKFFGGRPKRIMYDLDGVFAYSENYGDVIFIKTFEEYVRKIGYQIIFCHAYDPQSKSVVENSIKKIKNDWLRSYEFCGIQSLNAATLKWLDTVGNKFISGSRRGGIPSDLFREEQQHLIPICGSLLTDKKRIFGSLGNNTVRYNGKEYELPLGTNLIMNQVQVEEEDGELLIYCCETGDEICRHTVSTGKEFVVKLPQSKSESVTLLKIRRQFGDDELFEKFFNGLKKQTPRYLAKQCAALLVATQHYDNQQLDEAFAHCLKVEICTFTQLMAFLIFKHGKDIAKRFLSVGKVSHYSKIAKELEVSENG